MREMLKLLEMLKPSLNFYCKPKCLQFLISISLKDGYVTGGTLDCRSCNKKLISLPISSQLLGLYFISNAHLLVTPKSISSTIQQYASPGKWTCRDFAQQCSMYEQLRLIWAWNAQLADFLSSSSSSCPWSPTAELQSQHYWTVEHYCSSWLRQQN